MNATTTAAAAAAAQIDHHHAEGDATMTSEDRLLYARHVARKAAAYAAALARQIARQSEEAEREIARVELGSKTLDRCSPGWIDKVDVATLGPYPPNRNIIEQVFGNFIVGFEEIRRAEHGCHTPYERGFLGRDRAHDDSLTVTWTRYILARRAAEAQTA